VVIDPLGLLQGHWSRFGWSATAAGVIKRKNIHTHFSLAPNKYAPIPSACWKQLQLGWTLNTIGRYNYTLRAFLLYHGSYAENILYVMYLR